MQGNGQAGDCLLKPAGVEIGVQVKSGEGRTDPGSSKRGSAHEQSPIITLGRRKRFRRPKVRKGGNIVSKRRYLFNSGFGKESFVH